MKCLVTILCSALVVTLAAAEAKAQRLELGLLASPTVQTDSAYEAFSSEGLNAMRGAMDLRLLVLNLSGFKILPFVGYRYATDTGVPFQVLNTRLDSHEFVAGLRFRKGLLKWMAIFLEGSGGVLYAKMKASPTVDMNTTLGPGAGGRSDYQQSEGVWTAGGLMGLEFYLPGSWMRSRGVKRFNFGGEIGAGYVFRGDLAFEPDLQSDSENAIDTETTPWGDLNLSGWVIQAGICLKFF